MTITPPLALVVEDEPFQRAAFTEVLRQKGMDVIECSSAEAAELLICRVGAELSLLVTDVQLEGALTGIDLAEFARVRVPNVRTVIVSGQAGLAIPDGVAFLAKPCLPADLVRIAAV
jgi:CheY-like chemotaxis protein